MELVCISHFCKTAAGAMSELKEAGATAVELFLGYPPHLDVTSSEQTAALRVALQASGLRPFSAHLSFGGGLDLSHPSAATREETVERLAMEMRLAARLGVEKVIAHPGEPCGGEENRPGRLAAAAEGMAGLMATAEDLSLDVAFENLPPGYIGGSAEELVALVDGLGSPRAGFCLDTGHCHLGKVPAADYVRAFAGRIFVIHWQDNDGTGDQHRFPGAGTLGWPAFFRALEEIGFDGPVTAECGPLGPLPLSECVRLGQLALNEHRAMYV